MTEKKQNIPLCVDLDGTLIRSDTLLESTIIAVRNNPLILFLFPYWILKGRLFFKQSVDKHGRCDAALLQYRREVIDYVKSEREKGRKTVLATASVKAVAEEVGRHTGIFDEIIASENINLRSEEKRKILTEKFGEKGFDYIGDSIPDLKVWDSAANVLIMKRNSSLIKKLRKNSSVIKEMEDRKASLKDFIKEIRVYQWIKNILVFLPLLMAHEISDLSLVAKNIAAFFIFSFAASSVYITNDLFDIESDRLHPRKRYRPVASGLISIPAALITALLFFSVSIAGSLLFLPMTFFYVLLSYLVLTTAYSFVLKRVYIVDIIILAGLYTIRLIAGGAAVNVEVSFWMLAFSMFLFLSLAVVKRYTELKQLTEAKKRKAAGRGYFVDDLSLLSALGTASGYLSVLVFALYVNSDAVSGLYQKPELLWAVAPLLLFWITRIWFLAHRGKMHDDPVVFTGKDPVSYLVGFFVIILIIGAAV